jgi:hypothetical protein
MGLLVHHTFPVYVPDRLVIGEIFYQSIMQGFNATLVKDKKRLFIPYGFQVGYYMVKYAKHANKEGQVHLEYMFMTGIFRKNDPKGLVSRHDEQVVLIWTYSHEKWEDELFTEDSQDQKEVEKRRGNPKVTIFSSLPFIEKIKMVNLGVSSSKETDKGKI